MLMILSSPSSPVILRTPSKEVLPFAIKLETAGCKTSLTSVLLPEPETPHTPIINPSGMSMLRPLMLFAVTPERRSFPVLGRRSFGVAIERLPESQAPVTLALFFLICARVPSAQIIPPCRPAPGPTSMIQSAAAMVSSSCSTTKTVLPRSRSASRVPTRRWLSRGCSPMEGSSSTYKTPANPDPIWLAKRMR